MSSRSDLCLQRVPLSHSAIVWNCETKGDVCMRSVRVSFPSSHIRIISASQTFFFSSWTPADFLVKRYWRRWGYVRMCEGVQTDNAGEIARLDWENPEKKDQRKNKKRGEKKIQRKNPNERLAPWGPKAGHGNWPRVGATSLSFFSAFSNMPSSVSVAVITACVQSLFPSLLSLRVKSDDVAA